MLDSAFFLPILATFCFSFAVALFYHARFGKRDIAVAITLYSLLIFAIVFFVSFQSSLGLGIGLLGVLSLVRLRSTPENLVDVGFIFYAITIGLLNSSIEHLPTLLAIDTILTIVLLLLTSGWLFRKRIVKTKIVLDEIAFKDLKNLEKVRKKIKKKYKVDAREISIVNVNYLKDSTTLEITYYAEN